MEIDIAAEAPLPTYILLVDIRCSHSVSKASIDRIIGTFCSRLVYAKNPPIKWYMYEDGINETRMRFHTKTNRAENEVLHSTHDRVVNAFIKACATEGLDSSKVKLQFTTAKCIDHVGRF